jgi:hypothetical protein
MDLTILFIHTQWGWLHLSLKFGYYRSIMNGTHRNIKSRVQSISAPRIFLWGEGPDPEAIYTFDFKSCTMKSMSICVPTYSYVTGKTKPEINIYVFVNYSVQYCNVLVFSRFQWMIWGGLKITYCFWYNRVYKNCVFECHFGRGCDCPPPRVWGCQWFTVVAHQHFYGSKCFLHC